MSKRRLVITAVLAGQSQSEVARSYGVSQGWISRLMTRYGEEGEAAFEPRSRRPASSPQATPPATVELVVRLRKELTDQGARSGRGRTTQAAALVLRPVPGRAAQPVLAGRLHPLPAHRTGRFSRT